MRPGLFTLHLPSVLGYVMISSKILMWLNYRRKGNIAVGFTYKSHWNKRFLIGKKVKMTLVETLDELFDVIRKIQPRYRYIVIFFRLLSIIFFVKHIFERVSLDSTQIYIFKVPVINARYFVIYRKVYIGISHLNLQCEVVYRYILHLLYLWCCIS